MDKPLIQYAVEEAYEAGIRHMIFVTGLAKRSIEDYSDTAYKFENELELVGKAALLKVARSIAPDDMFCSYVRQPRVLGLGHAVLCAKKLVGQSSFAVLLADDLMVGRPGITVHMVRQFERQQVSLLAVQDVPLEHTSRYGIVIGQRVANDLHDLDGIVEKPSAKDALSTLAVAGGDILKPAIFDELANLSCGVGGEIQLTDGIAQLLRREKVFAFRYQGKRYDCGSKLEFLQATVDLAEHYPEVGEEFATWLAQREGIAA